MPTPLLDKIARVTGRDIGSVEADWAEAKSAAKKSAKNKKEPYGLAVYILKKGMSKKALKKAGWKSEEAENEGHDPVAWQSTPQKPVGPPAHDPAALISTPQLPRVIKAGQPGNESLLPHYHPDEGEDVLNMKQEHVDAIARQVLRYIADIQHHSSGMFRPEEQDLYAQMVTHKDKPRGLQPMPHMEPDEDYIEYLAAEFKQQNPSLLMKLKKAMKNKDYRFLLGKIAAGSFWAAALMGAPYLIGGGLALRAYQKHQQYKNKEQHFIDKNI